MVRSVSIAVAALIVTLCTAQWVQAGVALGDGRTAAAGIAEVTVLAAMIYAGRWTDGNTFGGRPPAF